MEVYAMKKRITVTEGLVELKLYGKKINKAVDDGKFVYAVKKSDKQVAHMSKEEASSKIEASYQSVTDLIKNRNALKSAIVQSNAVTMVKVGDKVMTVAEAIERKSSIEYEKDLLTSLECQYVAANEICNKE